ncbi:uncharacterized protein PRCAT00003183001 [Priceomyces carsonii]|uniref:uncharacterized protein n=1 Tax=Priceomyces carsonii TaxID=28549 RepID=UPI002ED7E37C|nr:unnamed protein product [Priceomyces carsonii]
MAKKTLAEQISQFSTPQTGFDIEDAELGRDGFESDEEELSSNFDDSDDELKKLHYVEVPKSNLRGVQSQPTMPKKYGGNRISRDELNNYLNEIDSEEEVSNGGSDDYGSEPEEDASSGGDSNNGSNFSERSDEGDDDDASEDEVYNDEIESAYEETPAGKSDEEEEGNGDRYSKKSKLKQILSNERKHVVNRMSNSTSSDALKGFAILQQLKFFDSIIDVRLKVQKSLLNSNLLPFNSDVVKSGALATNKTDKYISEAEDKCYDLLDSIFALRHQLLTKDSITSEPRKIKPRKRTYDDYLGTSKKFDSILNSFRESALTKWSAKIQNASGSNALNASKFKVINQSAEQQVQNNLSDMDRLVKRTHMNRRRIKPLGVDLYFQNNKQETGTSEMDVNADIPIENESTNVSDLTTIDKIYDDDDFYRVLLNDLVDKKVQSSDPTSGFAINLTKANNSQKFKKNIDTKASKGRKLRYHVQELISNFEAPKASWKWDDNQIDEFFASLLGQKVNMDEQEDEDSERDSDSNNDDVTVTAGDNGIKLFG